ncbi:FxsA family protein [Motiliproteus sediminis]|uniref:FxsA family protein n=1 Tax=Motiliproteus sediminis TaxID=1468178 RepID=UPI001AEFC32D|nr:FxsA family protein [Motiliproteus sediminis]
MPFLFVLFVVLPLTEIVILIQVGQAIGAWYTIGLVLLSAFIGVNMLRQQGLSTLLRARSRMDSGEIPAKEMVEGLILAVGGALLVTPGFVTDAIGFSCLIPVLRNRIVKELQKRSVVMVNGQMQGGREHEGPFRDSASGHDAGPFRSRPGRHGSGRSSDGGDVIDGEYRRED